MIFFDRKDRTVFCPNCKKLIAQADKRDTKIHKILCFKCHKWIWYKPSDENWFEIKQKPIRMSSAGKRFY